MLLPRIYQFLMTSDDSPLIEYYPMDFGIDQVPLARLETPPTSCIRSQPGTPTPAAQDGKKNPWEAVVLLAFMDEHRLVAAVRPFYPLV